MAVSKMKSRRCHITHDIRQTSLIAFMEERPHLGPRQLEVLKAIRDFNRAGIYPTDREITRKLGYADPNRVRPRRYELMIMGFIVEAGKKVCPISGKLALAWKISPHIVDNIDYIIEIEERRRR